jgi:hypothetical protein
MPSLNPKFVAGIIATACCVIQFIFQLSLAMGSPWGKAAWGDGSAELATGLRIASAIMVPVWVLAASILLQQAGLWNNGYYSDKFCHRFTWCWTIFLFFESALNFASRSPNEGYMWGPFALVFVISCLVLAKSGSDGNRSSPDLEGLVTEEDTLVPK